ncbi:MAG: hypothetical protein IPJ74_11115 [Saprospiraceae bacterium]|nr:hypothetical protein [Saprospiraceae bacterium]
MIQQVLQYRAILILLYFEIPGVAAAWQITVRRRSLICQALFVPFLARQKG